MILADACKFRDEVDDSLVVGNANVFFPYYNGLWAEVDWALHYILIKREFLFPPFVLLTRPPKLKSYPVRII